MNILLAIKGFDQIPNLKEEDSLHIIFSKDSTVPAILLVSMLHKTNITTHFLEEKRCDDIAIAMMIGKIIADTKETEVTIYCPTEAQVKVFDGIHLEDAVVKAKKITNATKPKRNGNAPKEDNTGEKRNRLGMAESHTSAGAVKEEEPKKRNRKITVPEKKLEFLIKAGIEEEYANLVLDAIENSSDAVIGFDMQLRTKLAAKEALDKLDIYKGIVTEETYKKLKTP